MVEGHNNVCCLKRIFFVVVFVGLLSFPLFSPGCCSSDPHEYYFEDVNVLVIGRCRTIGAEGPWTGGLYQGRLSVADVDVCDTWLERINVIVYNTSLIHPYKQFLRLTNNSVFMLNSTGIFFYGVRGSCVRCVPPVVFVWCRVDRLWIRDADWEPG